MDVALVSWLRTSTGRAALEVAQAAYVESGGDPMAATTLVRRQLPALRAEEAAAALTQADLRRHARTKFGADADAMLFTRDGLEQATRGPVSTHRAARLAAAHVGSVLDLGCGVGGDLVAFARAGLVSAGVDLDPVRVALAQANLDALGLNGATRVADATRVDRTPFGAVFCDPARRRGGTRIFDADGWTPPWEFVQTVLSSTACVKVAPGIPHTLVPSRVEAEWVSDRGEVKEAVLWSPALATVSRRATVIGEGGLATLTDEDDACGDVRPLGRFLYEPDGAVIRAGLVTAVAAGVRGGLIDPKIAYVTSEHAYRSPFAKTYEIVEELPFREKQLKAALRARNLGALTIKKRGVAVVPDQLRRRLGLRGEAEATLVMTRVADVGRALLVRPVLD